MSKRAVAALGLVIAAVGFGLGRYTASPPEAGESESGTARPGKVADTPVDESKDTLATVLRDPDAFSRARRLATLLPALGPEAVPELRAALEDPGIELQGAEVELLVRFWATHEPADASEWAFTRTPPGYRGPAMALAIELWAREDPQAALKRELIVTVVLLHVVASIPVEDGDVEGRVGVVREQVHGPFVTGQGLVLLAQVFTQQSLDDLALAELPR